MRSVLVDVPSGRNARLWPPSLSSSAGVQITVISSATGANGIVGGAWQSDAVTFEGEASSVGDSWVRADDRHERVQRWSLAERRTGDGDGQVIDYGKKKTRQGGRRKGAQMRGARGVRDQE